MYNSKVCSFSLELSRCIRVRSSQNIVTPFTNNSSYNKKQLMHGLGNNGKEGER